MKKKYVLKKSFKLKLFKLLLLIIVILVIRFLFRFKVKELVFNENNIEILFNRKDVSCIISSGSPTLDDKWILAKDKKCILNYKDGINNIYIKYDEKIKNITKNKIYDLKVKNKKNIYIANNGKYNYFDHLIGKNKKLKFEIENEEIISFDKTGNIKGLKTGKSKLTVSYKDISHSVNVIVSDLITSDYPRNDYDFSKNELECDTYSKEDNDLLDEILKDRINDAGYKTRAGAVEAARFLVLEFPYKLSYFYENGRQTTNNVDGEGRYYHEGLYLHESRYSNITGGKTGPETWGCPLYCNPGKRYIDNGLDCSGYVSWALLNAGFDVKDVGAGFSNKLDLTDYGDVVKFNDEIINSGKIKVGDLVHSEHSGGHIGMIIGIDEDWFYIAQALWNDAPTSLTKKEENVMAVQITKYGYKEIQNVLPDLVLMDKYYIEDGNLTSMW
ncbi:MAG: hypothetical protein IJ399_03075 [Bacilli bacterium]|nr:hypothetical protein [Bacilli bacterium]